MAPIDLAPRAAPPWWRGDRPASVPLPPGPARSLPGTVVAWARDPSGERIPLVSRDADGCYTAYDWPAWRDAVIGEAYCPQRRPWYTHGPLHYHRVPAAWRTRIARWLLADREAPFAVEMATGWRALEAVVGDAAVLPLARRIVLTHDIDTRAGFQWVPRIASLELRYGFRSLWNVVACRYAIDHGVLRDLAATGFEIGLHGYNHDNRLAFLPESRVRRRLDRCRPLIERYGIRAFRSPCWLRTPRLFRILRDYVSTDYSRLDVDRCSPGGAGGCLTTRPFTLEGLTHVPTTVPFELPTLLGGSPATCHAAWRGKIDWLAASGGFIVVNTHPDPHYSGNSAMLDAYEALLGDLAERVRGARPTGLFRPRLTEAA